MLTASGIPGLRGVEHVGFTVPDITEATRFFVDVIGCTPVYALGPINDPDGDWMEHHLDVPRDVGVREIRFFRCRHGANFEVFEYEGGERRLEAPRNCDIGGHHLAFYVNDFDAALEYLKQQGVKLLGTPTIRTEGPSAGQTWIYFQSPWGMQLELVSYPAGKDYEATAAFRLWHPAHPAD